MRVVSSVAVRWTSIASSGQVVPQNYEEAVKWYRLAAEQECAPAQCNLGLCYETGHGVEQNVREYLDWLDVQSVTTDHLLEAEREMVAQGVVRRVG